MKTLILSLMSFVLGLVVALGAVMSPVHNVTDLGNNVLLPKDDFKVLTSTLKASEKDLKATKQELRVVKEKWYNKTGEWVEDLF